jgi:diguanylate cyclase (GGDEF)-like protein
MHPIRQQFRIWRLLPALAIFLTSLYFSYSEIGQANSVASSRLGHHTHALFKTYEEVDRLMSTLSYYTQDDPVNKASLEDVQLDFELLVGRSQMFREGGANRELLEFQNVSTALDSLSATLSSIEPLIATLTPDRYDPLYIRIHSLLSIQRAKFISLAKLFLLNTEVRNDELTRSRTDIRNVWLIAAPIFSGFLLLVLYFLQLRQSMVLAQSLKAESHKLTHQATHDFLTGLPNSAFLKARLPQTIHHAYCSGSRFAVMFLDLDRFKEVNDSFGHSQGDVLLRAAAKRLASCVRGSDIVARISGDEFVLLIEDIGSDDSVLSVIVNRVFEQLRAPFQLDGQEVSVTGSIGISLYPEHGEVAELLLMNADAAMYSAKASGRNSIRSYDAQMNAGSVARVELSRDLRFALEREQLVLHYQPLVKLESGQIYGVEALLRWQHPSRGLLTPDTFITIAEETGLILPIGEWVTREACAQAMVWHKQGLPLLKMAVNLSALQLQQPDLAKQVADALDASGFPAELLVMELTETQLMRDVELAVTATEAMQKLGVGLAVDDFGTGYCSLSYLQLFPVSKLKIDRSFVQHLFNKPNAMTITRSVINLSKSLGLEVLAEGIETPEQLAFLRDHDCGFGQGYLFSRPLAAADFVELMRAN